MKDKTKMILKPIAILLVAILVVILSYVAYVLISYNRLPDNISLEINNPQSSNVRKGREYTITTYNVGFGAYSSQYSFFLDSAIWKDGTTTTGKYGKGISRDDVINNIEGEAAALRELSPDFIFLQEVDRDATRSYHINMVLYFSATFPFMSSVYAENFHSPWLNLPLFDPHGKSNAGLLTLSSFNASSATRRSYPIANDFSKLFDLDRCFSVERFPVENGKELVLVNSHMSAYDEGGIIRKAQLELLSTFLSDEYNKGNWVIVGGDFNHSLGEEFLNAFESEQIVPDWANVLEDKDLPEHFSIVRPINGLEIPSIRNCDTPYEEGVTYTTVVDGFIISDNIKAWSEVYNTDFLYSDHQPVTMHFTLV